MTSKIQNNRMQHQIAISICNSAGLNLDPEVHRIGREITEAAIAENYALLKRLDEDYHNLGQMPIIGDN